MTSTPFTPKYKKYNPILSPGTWVIQDSESYWGNDDTPLRYKPGDYLWDVFDENRPLKNKEPKKEEPKPIPEGWE